METYFMVWLLFENMTYFCKGGNIFTDQVVLPGGIILTYVSVCRSIFYHSLAARGKHH